MNLRNYWKIGFQIDSRVKDTTCSAGVLSIIEYCNAIYGGLTESDLQKFQKLQISAVRFVLDLKAKHVNNIFPHTSKSSTFYLCAFVLNTK